MVFMAPVNQPWQLPSGGTRRTHTVNTWQYSAVQHNQISKYIVRPVNLCFLSSKFANSENNGTLYYMLKENLTYSIYVVGQI